LINHFKITHPKRTTYDNIDIEFKDRANIVKSIFDQDKKILEEQIANTKARKEITKITLEDKNANAPDKQALQKTIAEYDYEINKLYDEYSELLDKIKAANEGTNVEFYENPQNNEKILQPIINGISPNICKVADVFLQMYATNIEIIPKLVKFIKTKRLEFLNKQSDTLLNDIKLLKTELKTDNMLTKKLQSVFIRK
jgi:hypothetical protein